MRTPILISVAALVAMAGSATAFDNPSTTVGGTSVQILPPPSDNPGTRPTLSGTAIQPGYPSSTLPHASGTGTTPINSSNNPPAGGLGVQLTVPLGSNK